LRRYVKGISQKVKEQQTAAQAAQQQQVAPSDHTYHVILQTIDPR